MNYYSLIAMIFFSIIAFTSFFIMFDLISKSHKSYAVMMIDPHTKDKKIPLHSYSEQIDEFLFLLKFNKNYDIHGNCNIYKPISLNRFFFSSLRIQIHPYYLEVSGDDKLVKMLALNIESDGSHFIVEKLNSYKEA